MQELLSKIGFPIDFSGPFFLEKKENQIFQTNKKKLKGSWEHDNEPSLGTQKSPRSDSIKSSYPLIH